jgi:hypothetical protein
MPPSPGPSRLKSDDTGTVLTAALYSGLALASMSLLFSVIELAAPAFYDSIEILDGINTLIQIPIMVIAVILWFIWLEMAKVIRQAVKHKLAQAQGNIGQTTTDASA